MIFRGLQQKLDGNFDIRPVPGCTSDQVFVKTTRTNVALGSCCRLVGCLYGYVSSLSGRIQLRLCLQLDTGTHLLQTHPPMRKKQIEILGDEKK